MVVQLTAFRRVVAIVFLIAAISTWPCCARKQKHPNGYLYATISSFNCSGEYCCDTLDDGGKCGCSVLGLILGKPAEVGVYHKWLETAHWKSLIVEEAMEQCDVFVESKAKSITTRVSRLTLQSHYIFLNGGQEKYHLGELVGHRLDLSALHENPSAYCETLGGTAIVSHDPEQRGCEFINLETDNKQIRNITLKEYVECEQDHYGPKCSKKCNAKQDCSNQGVCDSDTGVCACNPGHLRDDCSEFCTREAICSGHGECKVGEDHATGPCECDEGYFGNDCSCTSDVTCSGHGECNTDGNHLRPCNCAEGFEGYNCNITVGTCENLCVLNQTSECYRDADNDWKCKCSPHTIGDHCEHLCTCKYGECDGAEHGACNREIGCAAGVFGPNCDQFCTCDNGECDDGIDGTGMCKPDSCECIQDACETKYWGKNCDLFCRCNHGDCPSTLDEFNPYATDENMEDMNECFVCNTGFYGPGCDHRCMCANGKCVDGPNGNGTCVVGSCTDDYSGENCNIKTVEEVVVSPATEAKPIYLGLFISLAVVFALVVCAMAVMYRMKVLCFAYRIPIIGTPSDDKKDSSELVYHDFDQEICLDDGYEDLNDSEKLEIEDKDEASYSTKQGKRTIDGFTSLE